MEAIDEQSVYQTVVRANEQLLARGAFSREERDVLAAWILGQQNRQRGFVFYPTALERRRGIRLLTGERPRTKLAADTAVDMETLRLLILLQPDATELRRLCEQAEWRLAHVCYGQICAVGECAYASISVLRYHTARGGEKSAEIISRGLEALRHDRIGEGRWRSFDSYYTLSWLAELEPGAEEGAPAELAYVRERCQRLLKRLKPEAPGKPFDGVRYKILQKVLSPAPRKTVAQDPLFALDGDEPFLALRMPGAVNAQGARIEVQ